MLSGDASCRAGVRFVGGLRPVWFRFAVGGREG